MSALEVVRYHDGERWQVALVKLGHKHMHAVLIDDTGVRVVSEPRESARFTQPLLLKGRPYPLEHLLRGLRRVGRERGITQGAKDILAEAALEVPAEVHP